MFKFSVKISVLPPEATSSHHPKYNEGEIKFDFENCALVDAINCALERKEYKDFIKRNKIFEEVFIYYTDINENWHYFNGTD